MDRLINKQTYTNRQIIKKIDGQTINRDRKTDRQTHRQTDKDRHTDRQTNTHTDRHTDKHTHRQTHRQTDRHTDRQTINGQKDNLYTPASPHAAISFIGIRMRPRKTFL